MTKFFNKFKEHCFWRIFGPFSQFWGQKIFFPENLVLSHTTSYRFYDHDKIQKKLVTQFQENAQT